MSLSWPVLIGIMYISRERSFASRLITKPPNTSVPPFSALLGSEKAKLRREKSYCQAASSIQSKVSRERDGVSGFSKVDTFLRRV